MDWPMLKLSIPERLRPAFSMFDVKVAYFRALRRWQKPGVKSGLIRSFFCSILIMMYGLFVGAAAALAPPMFSISLAALPFAFLLWSLPELPGVPVKVLRRTFFICVVIFFCVPSYYMVQIPGLPWISIIRIALAILSLEVLYTVAASKRERSAVGEVMAGEPLLRLCVIGFLFMATISLVFSDQPFASLSAYTNVTLGWYLPFFACLLAIRTEDQAAILYKTIAILSIFVAALGIGDFVFERHIAIELIPKTMLSGMMQANPSIADMVNGNPYRNGHYRASSVYNVSLSFGEFAAMVAPIGGYFILHGNKVRERLLGFVVVIGAVLSVFVSGSRGGSIGFLIAMPLLLGLWILRFGRANPRSLVGPLAATLTVIGVSALLALVLAWKRLSNIVMGGGETAGSNDSRILQFKLALPHIIANPITGHGIGRGAEVTNYYTPSGNLSIDSYLLSLLVETGIPGALFFFGAIAVGSWTAIRIYLKDKDPRAEVAGPIASSFIAFAVYRLFLSQRENMMLFYILIALTFIVSQASARRLAAKSGEILKKGRAPEYRRLPEQAAP